MSGILQAKLVVSLTSFFLLFCLPSYARINFLLGPEIYHLERTRDGGTSQSGFLTGGRATFERICPWGWYLGADLLVAKGDIDGENSLALKLHSTMTDVIYEGRVGFTFQNAGRRKPFFTPFIGYGRFKETNDFKDPSPLTYTFVDTFDFISAGFLSGIYCTPQLTMGINFKARFMLNAESRVKNDPVFDDTVLKMKNELNTRIELPLTYRFAFWRKCTFFQFAPFYEYRHFGGQEGFPFDFNDTQFHLFGARLQLGVTF